MYARQPTNFTIDRPNFRKTPAIWTSLLVQDIVKKNHLFQKIKNELRHLTTLHFVLRISFDYFLLKCFDLAVAVTLIFVGSVECLTQAISVVSLYLPQHLLIQLNWSSFAFLNIKSFVQLFLPTAEPVDFLMGDHQ